MIEIKCDEVQQCAIIDSLYECGICVFGRSVDCKQYAGCTECYQKNIKWFIEEE